MSIHPDLVHLRTLFVSCGFDLRIVGGYVRDTLMNIVPKDSDLCTNATPDQQIALYRLHCIRYVETGLQHGTLTVVLNDVPYEITSLRVDRQTDGRHAVVEFTNDWTLDQFRRDLTINSIAMTFDGQIIDPFNGVDDLKNKRVRFVGQAEDRITEDYLRILRWIRFHGRVAKDRPFDSEAMQAVRKHASGLRRISKERIWSEVNKIIALDCGPVMMTSMFAFGLMPHMDFVGGRKNIFRMQRVSRHTTDSVTRLVAFVEDIAAIQTLATNWKWSNEEKSQAMFLAQHIENIDVDIFRLMVLDGVSRYWAEQLAVLQERTFLVETVRTRRIPIFPVTGDDLLSRGIRPSRQMGEMLNRGKMFWADANYTLSKHAVLEYLFSSLV